MSYGHSADSYGKNGGLEGDHMTHSSQKNISPAFDTGFYDAPHGDKVDQVTYEGGSSPDSVSSPKA